MYNLRKDFENEYGKETGDKKHTDYMKSLGVGRDEKEDEHDQRFEGDYKPVLSTKWKQFR